MFVLESILLSTIGGVLGLFFASIVLIVIQKFFPAYLEINAILLAIGVSSIIGIIFGILPARRASQLSPIEAIRYE